MALRWQSPSETEGQAQIALAIVPLHKDAPALCELVHCALAAFGELISVANDDAAGTTFSLQVIKLGLRSPPAALSTR
jgi:hypothetical protein